MGMQINASASLAASPAQVEGRYIHVHYLRREGSAKVGLLHSLACTHINHQKSPCTMQDWGLHAWHEVQQPTAWGAPLHPTT